jgi:hypothetical protein
VARHECVLLERMGRLHVIGLHECRRKCERDVIGSCRYSRSEGSWLASISSKAHGDPAWAHPAWVRGRMKWGAKMMGERLGEAEERKGR